MAARSPSVRKLSARAGALAKHHGPSDPRTVAARRDIAVETVADAIERLVREAPPLSQDQRDRLSLLLRRPAAMPS